MIDLQRRFFLFGAAATLILPPVKTFHILDGRHGSLILRPQGLFLPPGKLFDLGYGYDLLLAEKLIGGIYRMSDIPRWVVLDQTWYDDMVRLERT
jgi:hypothetical protein